MRRFGETKTAKEEFYAAKKSIKIRDVNVDKIHRGVMCHENEEECKI